MPSFDADRLTTQEASDIARLHADRLAAEQAERERLAETTAPEDMASMLGITPDEVRELAASVRKERRKFQADYVESEKRLPVLPLRILAGLAATVVVGVAFYLGQVSGRMAAATTSGFTNPGIEPAVTMTAPPLPSGPRVIPVIDPSVSLPPAGSAVILGIGDRVFTVIGPPTSEFKPLGATGRAAMRRTVDELTQFLSRPGAIESTASAYESWTVFRGPFDGRMEISYGAKRTELQAPTLTATADSLPMRKEDATRVDAAVSQTDSPSP